MRRFTPGILLLALLVLIGYGLSPPGRNLLEALSLLTDVWSLGARPAGGERRPRTISYDGPAGEARIADLYCDESATPEARLLLAHGLVDIGKDDARLRALGAAFARHRVLVMVPDFPGMRALRLGTRDIDEVAAALDSLGRIDGCGAGPSAARRLQTGVVGFSYSAGPVLLALGRPVHRADFAVLFGGYYDLEEVVRFLTTGRSRDRGIDQGGEALPQGRWILLEAEADLLGNPADRDALAAIGRRRRADPQADIGDLAAALGPSARAALDLLANTDPDRFDTLLGKIDPAIRRTLDALSPAQSLAGPLSVDLYLLHGRSDAIIPYIESLKLAREVKTTGRVELALLGGFRHARPDGAGRAEGWWSEAARYPADSLRLLGVLKQILARRGREAAPPRGQAPGESP